MWYMKDNCDCQCDPVSSIKGIRSKLVLSSTVIRIKTGGSTVLFWQLIQVKSVQCSNTETRTTNMFQNLPTKPLPQKNRQNNVVLTVIGQYCSECQRFFPKRHTVYTKSTDKCPEVRCTDLGFDE